MNKQKSVYELKESLNFYEIAVSSYYSTSLFFSYDFVKIYNGGIADANLIPDGDPAGSFTGTSYTGTTITVVGTTVTINLLSDSSETKAGFQIEYTAGKCVATIW